jgi:hypothetical protein
LQRHNDIIQDVMKRAADQEVDAGKRESLLASANSFYGGKKVIFVLNSLQQLAALEGRIRSKGRLGDLQVDLPSDEPVSFWELPALSGPQVSKVSCGYVRPEWLVTDMEGSESRYLRRVCT